MRTLLVMTCFLAFGVGQARADFLVRIYRDQITSKDDKVVMMLRMYIRGLGTGIALANEASSKKLYCQASLPLDIEDYLDIIDHQIAEISKRMPASEVGEERIGSLLMIGLRIRFPCGSK